ncbi:MAG: hypothetical protein U1E29_12780 [Coriobacteriia bacterium]|nr:hypothetical protein [Coriobacteriia bacterium]
MTNHFEVLGLAPGAKQEEVSTAFEELLANRRARRQKTGDLHAAIAVLSDPTLRRAHEIALFGDAAGDKLVVVKNAAVEVIQEIDIRELLAQVREVALKVTVVGSGAVAKVAESQARGSRALQRAAARRLAR